MKTIKTKIDAHQLATKLAERQLSRDVLLLNEDDYYQGQDDGSVALTEKGQHWFDKYYADYLETIEDCMV